MQIDSEAVLASVQTLFENSGMSVAGLSDKSGVPVTSITRYFSGETKSPNFYNLCAVIAALGGSVDEIIGSKNAAPVAAADDRFVTQLRSDLRYERRAKRTWATLFIIAITLFVAFLIFDITHPAIGYIQYVRDIASYYQEPTSFLQTI